MLLPRGSSRNDRASVLGTILLIGDMGEPGDRVSLVVDLGNGDMRHEAVGRGAVPMEFLRFEENAVARTDFFHWTALALATSDSFEYTDGLPMAQNFQSIAA